MNAAAPQIRTLALNALVLSQSPVQVERRSLIDHGHIKEMSVTIKKNGRVEQPITVRPFGELDQFEVVDGEHRVMATEEAGLSEILAEVRELTDEQVEEIQIITGLQKVKLHELVEAEGYEVLHRRGMSVEEIATKVGNKSTATIYAKMKLLALCKEAREAFRAGKIGYSVALLVARIPVPKLQLEALKEIAPRSDGDEAMSYRDAQHLIHRRFMLDLKGAPFPTDDATLVGHAGACGTCLKNTTCQPELFADVSTKATCTDPTCFRAKTAAHTARLVEKAKENGQRVIDGPLAKKVTKYGEYSLQEGFVQLDQTCFESPGGKSYGELLGRSFKPDLLVVPESGTVIKVVEKAAALKQLRAEGKLKKEPKRVPTASGSSKAANQKAEREREIEVEFDKRLYLALHAKAPKQLQRAVLNEVAERLLEGLTYNDRPEQLFSTWAWQKHGPAQKDLQKLSEAQLHQLIFELTLFQIDVSRNYIADAAKRLGIDAKKIRAEVKASLVPPAPAKASKKKAGKK